MSKLKRVGFKQPSLDKMRRWFLAQDYTIEGNRATSRCRNHVWCFDGRVAIRIV